MKKYIQAFEQKLINEKLEDIVDVYYKNIFDLIRVKSIDFEVFLKNFLNLIKIYLRLISKKPQQEDYRAIIIKVHE